MTAPRYSRDELDRVERSLRALADELGAGHHHRTDLEHAADFLAETVAVLDKQKRNRQRRAAQRAIEAKKDRRK